jgi:hypothetical protein
MKNIKKHSFYCPVFKKNVHIDDSFLLAMGSDPNEMSQAFTQRECIKSQQCALSDVFEKCPLEDCVKKTKIKNFKKAKKLAS